MQVEEVTAGRRSIIFSGTAAQVQTAFHTAIHIYKIGDEVHHANVNDPEIPAALVQVVGGVVSLHDFHSEPMHGLVRKPSPDFSSGGAYYLAPADFATIYDLNPLYQQSITGSGQSVAIVARSNINIADARQFRTFFGLPANDPQIIVNGTDPGIWSANEETEADLDVEWSGAVAKSATIKFVVSKSTNSSDGVDLSAQYIVNHNLAPVMSTSFGLCEACARFFRKQLSQQPVAASGRGRHHRIRFFRRQRRGRLRFRFGLNRHARTRRQRPVLHALQRLCRRHRVQRPIQPLALLVALELVGHAGISAQLHSRSGLERKRSRLWTVGERRRREHSVC